MSNRFAMGWSKSSATSKECKRQTVYHKIKEFSQKTKLNG